MPPWSNKRRRGRPRVRLRYTYAQTVSNFCIFANVGPTRGRRGDDRSTFLVAFDGSRRHIWGRPRGREGRHGERVRAWTPPRGFPNPPRGRGRVLDGRVRVFRRRHARARVVGVRRARAAQHGRDAVDRLPRARGRVRRARSRGDDRGCGGGSPVPPARRLASDGGVRRVSRARDHGGARRVRATRGRARAPTRPAVHRPRPRPTPPRAIRDATGDPATSSRGRLPRERSPVERRRRPTRRRRVQPAHSWRRRRRRKRRRRRAGSIPARLLRLLPIRGRSLATSRARRGDPAPDDPSPERTRSAPDCERRETGVATADATADATAGATANANGSSASAPAPVVASPSGAFGFGRNAAGGSARFRRRSRYRFRFPSAASFSVFRLRAGFASRPRSRGRVGAMDPAIRRRGRRRRLRARESHARDESRDARGIGIDASSPRGFRIVARGARTSPREMRTTPRRRRARRARRVFASVRVRGGTPRDPRQVRRAGRSPRVVLGRTRTSPRGRRRTREGRRRLRRSGERRSRGPSSRTKTRETTRRGDGGETREGDARASRVDRGGATRRRARRGRFGESPSRRGV